MIRRTLWTAIQMVVLVAVIMMPSSIASATTATPDVTPTVQVECTPPLCQPGEVFYCPGECLGGCGTQCATPTPTEPICGNGVVESGEDCDDGGTCIGGSNAGTHCTSEADCQGNGMCVGGAKDRTGCADDMACPGGLCIHCVPQGGDGCAANCTLETDVPFPLIPGVLDGGGLNVIAGTSGVAITSDFISLPEPFGGICAGGNSATFYCLGDADCAGGACVQAQQVLTVGEEKNGMIPVVVRAVSIQIPGIHPGIGCACIRGVAAQTCGGTFLESDGVTLSLDCTPSYTAGDSTCTAAGKPPCTFVHGEGNSASGKIGCEGLDNINVNRSQDSGGASGLASPPMIAFSGSGGPGSASVLSSTGITVVLGACTGNDPSTYGPDGIFCTADDPPGGLIAVEATSPAVTGTATAVVLNANDTDGSNLGPVSVIGAPFSCSALAQGSAAGGGLAQAFTGVHLETVGDVAFTGQFFANGTVPPTPTPTSTPTPTGLIIGIGDFCEPEFICPSPLLCLIDPPHQARVCSCVGDCDGNAEVTVDELVTLVNIALGNMPESMCSLGDVNEDHQIDISEILQAVNNALYGCGAIPARAPTAAPTPMCSASGENCSASTDCCSGSCVSFDFGGINLVCE